MHIHAYMYASSGSRHDNRRVSKINQRALSVLKCVSLAHSHRKWLSERGCLYNSLLGQSLIRAHLAMSPDSWEREEC